jgi:hypothetical protein
LAAPPVRTKRTSEADSVILEDESGRVGLIGDILAGEKLVTGSGGSFGAYFRPTEPKCAGVTVAVLGFEGPTAEFEVQEIVYAGLAPPTNLPNGTPNECELF